MKRTTFILLALVLMALVGFYIRAGWDKAPKTPQGGDAPATPHETTGAYENCLACHGNITASHNELFGEGNYDDCLKCHKPK
ncbi:MAG TPA: hypothetical protein GX699_04000 [Firmicutes bacterium]|nr:hypothetical protein [Bacillota bacterium]